MERMKLMEKEASKVAIWTIFVRETSRNNSPTLTVYGESPCLNRALVQLGGPPETRIHAYCKASCRSDPTNVHPH